MEIIIVLGNANEKIWRKRVERAVEYFNLSDPQTYFEFLNETIVTKYILLTGYNHGKSKTVEDSLKWIQDNFQIDSKFLLFEMKSTSTVENFLNTKYLISQNFKDYFKPDIVICTSTFHIKRSMTICKFIMSDFYHQKFIHTNEKVQHKEYIREINFLDQFLEYYLNN